MEGKWLICINSYFLENGTEIPKGRMEYSNAQFRQACSPNWSRATEQEIETKDWYKGNYFNLKNV